MADHPGEAGRDRKKRMAIAGTGLEQAYRGPGSFGQTGRQDATGRTCANDDVVEFVRAGRGRSTLTHRYFI
jgi:hypothetical protein